MDLKSVKYVVDGGNFNLKTNKIMKNTRIIKRTMFDGKIKFTIQQKHFLSFWWWVDAWVNNDVSTTDSFSSLEEAQKNLCYFDGTKIKQEIITI